MKSPQGRESKKPKKTKVKSKAQPFENAARKTFQVPQSDTTEKPKED
jgi:hypothetical protein